MLDFTIDFRWARYRTWPSPFGRAWPSIIWNVSAHWIRRAGIIPPGRLSVNFHPPSSSEIFLAVLHDE